MPIINTQEFWDYVVDEPLSVVNTVKEILTFKNYNFDKKTYDIIPFYQVVGKYCEDVVLRYPSGLTKYLREKLLLDIEYKSRDFHKYTGAEVLEVANEVHSINPDFEVRDYQIEAALTSLNRFASLIHSSVGSGKSSIMCLVCKILSNDRILIMNGNNFILQQIYDRLLSFGIDDVSWNPSKEPDYTKRIVLINNSSSDSRLNNKNEDYLNFLKEVNTVIHDEAQHSQSITAFEPIFYMDPDKLRHFIGYSGSPFRNADKPYKNLDDFVTIALLGEPAFNYDMANTIADGNIAQPYSYFINFPNRPGFVPEKFKDSYFMQYRSNIIYNKARNNAGMEMLKFLNRNGIKTLASFNNIKPGQNLLKTLKEQGVNGLFICGDSTIYEWIPNKRGTLKLETRSGTPEDIKKALHDGYNIVVGSTVLDEGVDISEFQAVVLFSAGKTCIPNIQRIGRVSRKKKDGTNISFVIDFKDIGGYYIFEEHYKKRKAMMEKAGVKNIEKVQDFMELIQSIGAENKKV